MKSLLQELTKINEEAAAGATSAGNIAGVRGGVGEVNSQSEFKKKKKKRKMIRRLPANVVTEADQVTGSNIIRKVRKAFPKDSIAAIQEWIRQANQFDQPLTVDEYADYRRYDEAGNLKEAVESTFDQADVISKLKQSERANVTDEETTTFALEDEDGIIIKVTVRKDQAEDFEAALGMALAAKDEDEDNDNTGQEIAEVLFDMKDRFEIVDVDFPAIPEDEEEEGQTVEGEGDDLDIEGEGGDEEGDDMDMEADDMDMEADTDEADAGTALTQVIDMMKADAEAKKAEAEARTAEAKAEESRYAAQASVAKVKQEEQILDMESHNDRKKKENEEAKRLAQLAKYKHEMDAEGEDDTYPEEEELTAAPEVSKEELLTLLQRMLRAQN